MTKKLSWRLSKLPTVEELQQLVKDEIITKEEAREVLFSDRELEDVKSLKQEIKFLKKLTEKLADSPDKIIETIRYIEKPYFERHWYRPYDTWCSNTSYLSGAGTIDLVGNSSGTALTANYTDAVNTSFSSI